MELLEFARGPVLTFAITVFIAGLAFRVVSLFALWRTKDSSAGSPREKSVFFRCHPRNHPAAVATGCL